MVDAAFWSRSWAQYMQVEPAPAIQMMHLGKETRQDEISIKNVRDENFVNKSWLSRKFKRLQISFYELPSFIKGLIKGNKRKLIFDKDELASNFDFLIAVRRASSDLSHTLSSPTLFSGLSEYFRITFSNPKSL